MTALVHNTERAAGARHQFLRLAVHQFRADLRCFLRNTGSVFWTLALPILFLAIFGSVFRHQNVAVPGGRIDEPVYYVPGIVAYGLIAATFSNLVVSVVRYREAGIYKRQRATPLSSGAIIAGRALVAALSALAPHWLIGVGKIFPVHALADAFLVAYNPHTVGSGVNWADLAILVAWGVTALIVATRRFAWLPRSH
jgi:hypothetical protein